MANETTPEFEAHIIAAKLGSFSIPTPLDSICDFLNITVVRTTKQDKPGIFVRKLNGQKFILIKDDIPYESLKRFALGHEIGHACLHGNEKDMFECTFEDMHHYAPNRDAESDANCFSAELLMPTKIFEPAVQKSSLSLETIMRLSKTFATSLTSTAIKYMQHTFDQGAVIFSRDGQYNFSSLSRSFRRPMRRGAIHPHTFAYDFFSEGKLLNGESKKVLASAWLLDAAPYECLVEETISMRFINATLSVIYPFIESEQEYRDEFDYE